MRSLALLAALLLQGCAGSYITAGSWDQDYIAKASDDRLCKGYYHTAAPAVRAELERRDLFDDAEWAVIDQSRIRVRDSEIMLYCSWGPASESREAHSLVGTTTVLRYGNYVTSIVWVRGGRVTNIIN